MGNIAATVHTPSAPSASIPSTKLPVVPRSRSSEWWQNLTRITTTTAYIPEIDGLRFLAIMGVMLYHLPVAVRYAPLPHHLKPWFVSGQLGVQLFFIISGFVLALPFARHELRGGPQLERKKYFMRRLTRLEPPYIISLCLCYFLHAVLAHDNIPAGHFLTGLFYLHWLPYSYTNPINPVTWSLEVEIQFYLLVPLLAMVFRLPSRVRRLSLLTVILISLVVNCISDFGPHGPSHLFEATIFGFLHFFLIGFLFADLYLSGKLRRATTWWDLLTLCSIVFVVYGHIHKYTDETTTTIGLSILFAAAFLGRWSKKVLHFPWISRIGGMCYSIYLIHWTVLQMVGVFAKHHAALLRGGLGVYAIAGAILLPLCVAISGLFFVLVERPCMDPTWPQKIAWWPHRLVVGQQTRT